MRLTSALWITVFRRREEATGAFVGISKKGNDEAGAIFVIHNRLDGRFTLFAPVPQMFSEPSEDGERAFEKRMETNNESQITEWLDGQKRMDDDFWVVEVESRQETLSLTIVDTEI